MKQKVSKMWYTFCPVTCVSHIALQKGFLQDEFAKDGIELTYINQLPIVQWRVHYTHRMPDLIRDGGNIPPIWTRSEGVDLNAIGMTWCDDAFSTLVAPDSPIKSVADLRGKRVALLRRLPSVIDYSRATVKRGIIMSLKAHGLTEKDVIFIDLPIDIPDTATSKEGKKGKGWELGAETGWEIPQQPAVEALQKGEVDAIFAFNGVDVMLEHLGLGKIIYNLNKNPNWKYRVNLNYPFVITVSGNLVREHPDLVFRWMKVLVRAGRWAKDNKLESELIMSKSINLPVELLRKMLPSGFHNNLVPEVSDRAIKALEIEKEFLKTHGFINNDFDIKSWVDDSFLNAALSEQ